MKLGRRRVGQRAVERRKSGGKRAVGRTSETREGYEALRRRLLVRAGARRYGVGSPTYSLSMLIDWARCECCGGRGVTGEIEHAKPRSAGGADDESNCWIPCPRCRDLKVAPFATGRLLVRPLGAGAFVFHLVQGTKRVHRVLRCWIVGRLQENSVGGADRPRHYWFELSNGFHPCDENAPAFAREVLVRAGG